MTSAHRDDVDGLRAVSVSAVVLFHAGAPGFGGGFVGVDVFFVISGYVIALSLSRDLDRGRFSPMAFYERRVRRILPAFVVVSFATFSAAFLVIPPDMFRPFSTSLSYGAAFLSNVFFWLNSGYWDVSAALQPLLHTWSLSVEEQYYLIAPLVIAAAVRWVRRGWEIGFALMFAISLALCLSVTPADPTAAFFLLPTRVWEFLLGALLAIRPPPRLASSVALNSAGVAGAVLIALPISLYSAQTPFPGAAAIVPCAGAAILIYSGSGSMAPWVSGVLSLSPLTAIGRLSYSLYLVHWPLGVLGHFLVMRRLRPGEKVLIIFVSVVVAAAVYGWVERPLRRATATRRQVFALALGALSVMLAVGWAGPRVQRALLPTSPQTDEARAIYQRAWREHPCLLIGPPDARLWRPDECRRTSVGDTILLWGDSFAAHYTPGIERIADRMRGSVLQYTAQGCPPMLSGDVAVERCNDFNEHALAVIARERIGRVVLAANWSEYSHADVGRVVPILTALQRFGVETTLIGQSPVFLMNPSTIAARRGQADAANAATATDIDAAPINTFLASRAVAANARFIDPMPHLCPREPCAVRVEGSNLYLDYGHFSLAGSAYAVTRYFPYVAP